MKIAHVICTFPPYKGGMGNSALHFANYITKFRHESVVFTPAYNKKNKNEFINNNPKLKVIRLKPVFSLGNSAIILQLLWLLPKYDIIHLHYPFYGGAEITAFLKIILGKKFKLIIHYHMDNNGKGIKGKIFEAYRKFFLPIILRLSDEITCASIDYIKHSNAGKYYEQHSNKFTQIPFGVDINKFKPKENKKEYNEKEYNEKERNEKERNEKERNEKECNVHYDKNNNIKKILFVGGLDRAHYFKGVDILIRAFAKLKQNINNENNRNNNENNNINRNIKNKNIKLIIVGKGELTYYYKQVAENLKIINDIEFISNANDYKLINYYQESNVLVLPSINKSEAFGLVILEAMACGKPVIASNLPGVRSVFRNNQEGLLVRPNNIDDLAEKLKRIITNDKLAKQYGESARKLVKEKYTWDKSAEKLNEVYYRVKNTLKVK